MHFDVSIKIICRESLVFHCWETGHWTRRTLCLSCALSFSFFLPRTAITCCHNHSPFWSPLFSLAFTFLYFLMQLFIFLTSIVAHPLLFVFNQLCYLCYCSWKICCSIHTVLGDLRGELIKRELLQLSQLGYHTLVLLMVLCNLFTF